MEKEKSKEKFRIRQIYFDKTQRGFLDSQFIPYFNEEKNKYLESKIISDLIKEGDHASEYYGVLSHFFRIKTGRAASQVFHWIERDNYSHDVYCFQASFTPSNEVNLYLQGNRWHPLFSRVAAELFEELNIAIPDTMPPIFYNYWICRSELVEKFVNELLDPAMKALENIPLAFENSEYRVSSQRAVNKERCMEIFGKPYYTYHPFICERLFPTFVSMNKLSYKFI